MHDDLKKNYLDGVCSEIRWKVVRSAVREELEGHIEDRKQEAILNGNKEDAATAQAVQAMGDPIETGKWMNSLHKPRVDIWMVVSVCMLAVFGFIFFNHDYGFNATDFKLIGCFLGVILILVDLRRLLNKYIVLAIMGAIGYIGLITICIISPQVKFWAIGTDWIAFMRYICILLFLVAFGGFTSTFNNKSRVGLIVAVFAMVTTTISFLLNEWPQYIIAICFYFACFFMIVCCKANKKWKTAFITMLLFLIALFLLYRFDYIKDLIEQPYPNSANQEIKSFFQNVHWIGSSTISLEYWWYILNINPLAGVFLKYGILAGIVLITSLLGFIASLIRISMRIKDTMGRVISLGCSVYIAVITIGNLLINAFFLEMSGNYLPFLLNNTEFLLTCGLSGIIFGLYLRKDIYPLFDPAKIVTIE